MERQVGFKGNMRLELNIPQRSSYSQYTVDAKLFSDKSSCRKYTLEFCDVCRFVIERKMFDSSIFVAKYCSAIPAVGDKNIFLVNQNNESGCSIIKFLFAQRLLKISKR